MPPQHIRLLAVDPALTATGFLIADVKMNGHAQPHIAWEQGGTVTTDPKHSMPSRLALLYKSTVLWHDMTLGLTGTDREGRPVAAPAVYAVLEDGGAHYGIRNARSIYALGLGVGTIINALALRLDEQHLLMVTPKEYLPQNRKGLSPAIKRPRDFVIAEGRRLLPQALCTASEHVCMAAYLAAWWIRHTFMAPLSPTG